MKYLFFLTFFSLFCSCSTLKDEDCDNRDWNQQGFMDASKGYSFEMYDTYLKVCGQSETPETKELYRNGHKLGAKKYCTYNKGELVGESGRPYPQVCPKTSFPEFERGYKKGKKKALKAEGPSN